MDPVVCLCSNARRAALALTSLYDAALAPHGMKITQFSLLRAIERHGDPNFTELAEGTGLVALSPGDDLRDRLVELTPRGRTKVRAAAKAWERIQQSLSSALGTDAERLVAVARRVTELARSGPQRSAAKT